MDSTLPRAACALMLGFAVGGCERAADPPVASGYWDCDALEMAALPDGRDYTLHLPGVRQRLAEVRDGRTVHYQSGQIRLVFVDERAELTIAGALYLCREKAWGAPWQRARDRGAAFRAIGQEPGWHVEVVPGGELTLVLDYGERQLAMPAPEPETLDDDARGYHGVAGGALVLVVIEDLTCFDIMSGEVFPETVTVAVDDERYRGCGLRL
jgi:uncharacterized membrane protein